MDKEFQMIAKNIKELRENRGYTQEQLAEKTGLSVSHLSKVESGQRRIGMGAYVNILYVLKISEEEFASIVIDEKNKDEYVKYQDIMKDCSEAEKKFLFDTLKCIKGNMKALTHKENCMK